MGEFKGPIVEGAYYEREDGSVVGPATPEPLLREVLSLWRVGHDLFTERGVSADTIQACGPRLTRRVYITHTDPAEVVAELRAFIVNPANARQASRMVAYNTAADLVAEKLGVKS